MARAGKVCRTSGCPAKVQRQGLCVRHVQEAESARGSSTQRGYGSAHQRRRAELLRRFTNTLCPVCGEKLEAWQDLEAGHSTPLRQNPDSVADQLVHRLCNPRGEHPFNTGVGSLTHGVQGDGTGSVPGEAELRDSRDRRAAPGPPQMARVHGPRRSP